MRSLLIATAIAAIGFALPAAAANDQYGQGYNQSGNQGYSQSQQGFGQGSSSQGQWNSGQGYQGPGQAWQGSNPTARAGDMRQRIYQDLSQAGFTDIRIIPRAFVVRAKDREGNPVEMLITPNSVTALTAVPSGGGSNGNYGGNNGTAQNNYGGGSAWSGGSSGSRMMGTNPMSNSAQSGNAINSTNGNGSYTR